MRKTEILPWTQKWNDVYKEEAYRLRDIFGNEAVYIFHIGSTSIQTIGYAKPIIDILIVVKDIAKVDDYNEKMKELGYDPRGENGIAGRRYFTNGKEKRTHHVHIYQEGNKNIEKHLSFKAYLIQHPDEAKKYGELKNKLAKKYPDDTHEYQRGKEAFVNDIVEKSRKWSSKCFI